MGGYYQTSALFWVVFVTLLQYSQGKPNNKIDLPAKKLFFCIIGQTSSDWNFCHFTSSSDLCQEEKKNLLFSHILIKTLALGILLVCQNMFRDKAWRDLENLSEFVIKMQK